MTAQPHKTRFAICLIDDEPDLQYGKIYRILPGSGTDSKRWLRVVDDSEEDYLYPANCFAFIELPNRVKKLIPRRPSRSIKAGVEGRRLRRRSA